jgi:hypothetical protein
MSTTPNCPQCGNPLTEIRYPSDSMLNRDQWESQLPGDLFCTCHNNHRGNKPYAYFWRSQLENAPLKTVTDHKYISEICNEKGCQYLVLTHALIEIRHLSREWEANRLGGVNLQVQRWQKLGAIANDALNLVAGR